MYVESPHQSSKFLISRGCVDARTITRARAESRGFLIAINQCATFSVRGKEFGESELLGQADEETFRSADVAEAIRVFIPDDLAYELRSALAEPLQRLVDVVDGEHDA